MMQGWADYLDRVRVGGKVIPFRQGRVAGGHEPRETGAGVRRGG